jgi:hypothetical protein
MTSSRKNELLDMFWQMIEKQLSAERTAELTKLIRDDVEVRMMYVQFVHLVAALRWRQAHPVGEALLPDQVLPAALDFLVLEPAATGDGCEVSKPAKVCFRLPQISARVLATMLCGLLIAWFLGLAALVSIPKLRSLAQPWRESGSNERRPFVAGDSVPAADNSPVARLTALRAVAWQPGSTPLTEQTGLISGQQLELAAGEIELTFADGATVAVEGPAQLRLHSNGRAELTQGKLVAAVPPQAIGFTVQTPAATIVDLGTEFGVTVDPQGRTETQVFKGLVEVASAGGSVLVSAQRAPFKQRLSAGEAVRIDSTGTVVSIAPRMARPQPFDKAELADSPKIVLPRTGVSSPPAGNLQLWLSADRGVEEQEVTPGELRVVRWKNVAVPDDPGSDLVQGNHPKTHGPRGTPAFDAINNNPVKALAMLHDREFPVVRFSGMTYLQNTRFPSSDSFTAFVVVKKNGEAGRLVGGGYTSYHNLLALGMTSFANPGDTWAQLLEWRNGVAGAAANTLGANFANDALDVTSPSFPPLLADDFQLVELRKSNRGSGLTLFYYNGYYVAQTGGTQAIGKGLFLGGTAFGGLNGDLAEVLIYGAAIDEEDRLLVEGLLAWKYGIQASLPPGHLYAKVDPGTAEVEAEK